MGRFETAAEFYKFREPYPEEFFARVVQVLGLNGQSRMLDVGCGPGNLAIGFSSSVGSVTALDVEPEMLRVAQEATGATSILFLQTPVEEFIADAGAFDFVTIGRAIHWLSKEPTLAVFERVIAKDGYVAVCSASNTEAECNAWTKSFRDVRRKWSGDHDEARYRPNLDQWFAASRFRRLHEIDAKQKYRISIDDLVGRGLSFSVTSPSVLGDKGGEFESELRSSLAPFAVQGWLEEEVMGSAIVFG